MTTVLLSLKNRLSTATFSSVLPSRNENSSPSYLGTTGGSDNTTEQTQQHSPDINHEIVGEIFFTLLWPMKCAGTCPLTIKNFGKSYGVPTIRTVLYAILCSLSITSCVPIYTLNRGFDIAWPFRLWAPLKPQEIFDSTSGARPPPRFFIWVTLGLQVLIPASSLVYGHLGLYHVSDFCSFLNGWTDYSKQFETHFSPSSYSIDFGDLKKSRRWYTLVSFPALLFTFLLIPFMSRTKVLQIAEGSSPVLGILLSLFWVQGLIGIRVVFNMRDFMNLNALEIGYRELRKGIETQYTVLQGKVNRLHVRNWLKMVVFIRNQRTLVEKHMGLQNNYMLIEIFACALLVLTASILVIMNEINEYLGWVATYVSISAALLFFLFFKAQLAEGISEQTCCIQRLGTLIIVSSVGCCRVC